MPGASAISAETQAQQKLTRSFRAFLDSLTPGPDDYARSRREAEDIIIAIRRALYPLRLASGINNDAIVIGSVGKRNALRPIRQVDVLYRLPSRLNVTSPDQALKIVRAAAGDQFEPDQVHPDDLGVRITCQDVAVRLMPARDASEGYCIPREVNSRSATEWLAIHPVTESASWRLSNSLTNGAALDLLTLLKMWKRTVHADVSSTALEVLAQQFYTEQPRHEVISLDFKAFMAWARSRGQSSVVRPGSTIAVHIGEAWHGKAKAAYWRATLAEQSGAPDADSAIEAWQALLGPQFSLRNSDQN